MGGQGFGLMRKRELNEWIELNVYVSGVGVWSCLIYKITNLFKHPSYTS